jgi:hypothetical protein
VTVSIPQKQFPSGNYFAPTLLPSENYSVPKLLPSENQLEKQKKTVIIGLGN